MIWFDMNLFHILYVRLCVKIIIETFLKKKLFQPFFSLYFLFSATANLFNWAELFKAGLRLPSVSARSEFRFESLKSISVLILFVYKLMIGSFKNNRENYPRKCLWTQEKETRVNFNTELSANRPSNNWALTYIQRLKPSHARVVLE